MSETSELERDEGASEAMARAIAVRYGYQQVVIIGLRHAGRDDDVAVYGVDDRQQTSAERLALFWEAKLAAWRKTAEPLPLQVKLFDWLRRRYAQRQDPRQAKMGLLYMTGETHELAEGLALFLLEEHAAKRLPLNRIDG